ncbi:MAG: cytochrome-c peroxidase [Methylococcaceae bacterium]|nr:cytochrome-c peroxidase [Methylococcaceae bacterium]
MRLILKLLLGLIVSSNALADQTLGLPPLNIPNDNPQSAEKIALGNALFNEKRFSADGTVSCASCHHSDKAFTDGLPVAEGLNRQTGTRNAPTVVNAAFFDTLFLDGRANSLETQALGPFTNPIEHGLSNHQAIVTVIQNDASYQKQFQTVFGVSADQITINQVTKAIASYERTLITGNSPFDRYLFGRDHSAMSISAERGLGIFKRKGNCLVCHEISWNNALFTDNRFYNVGVGFKRLTPVLDDFIVAVNRGENPDDFPLTDAQRSELGRFNVTKVIADIGKFKTPTLRNIAFTAPYMHDGSIKTLAEVVEHYDKGGNRSEQGSRFIDTEIFQLHLTPQEKADLVAFMRALTSGQHSLFKNSLSDTN